MIPDINKYNIASHLASGTLGIITNTVPLFIYPLAILVKEESFNFKRLIGVLIGMIGILCIVMPVFDLSYFKLNIWSLLALIMPFSYALCSIYIVKYCPNNCDSIMLCAGMMLMALILLSPILLDIKIFYTINFTFNFLNLAIISEIILSTIAYILLFELLKNAGSIFYSLTDGIGVITSLFWGYLFFHEKIHSSIVFAVMFIFLGIGLIAVRRTEF